ncbi:MAG: S9 family peptidase [Steroidobacteraceae bacterium]|nr:S9 family peptidase [Steroidobacteraceae bacterium]
MSVAILIHAGRAAAWLLMAVSVSFAVGAAEPNRLESRDIFALETANDTQISPDGKQIVYVRGSYDVMTDRPRANLWIVNTDGSQHRPLRSDANNHRSPRWSPDGTRIAYISDAEGKAQLFVRWMDTGQTALLTNLTESPGDLTWSPDGRLLAFTQLVAAEKPSLAKPPQKPEGANWAPPVTVIDDVVYRVDGQGYLKSGYTHVFLIVADGGAPRQLTSGDFNHRGTLAFTPDGKRLLLSANRRDDWQLNPVDSDIHAVDLASGAMTQLTQRDGPDVNPVVAPDGKTIAYLGFDDRRLGHQIARLYIMNADGSNARAVSDKFDFNIEDPVWAANGRSLYFVYDDAGIRRIASISLDGKIRVVAAQVGSADIGRPYTGGGFSAARTGQVAFVSNSALSPGNVAVSDARGRSVRTLTALNADLLAHRTLGAVERITWRSSADQREIEGWIVTPPDFDANKKYPLILEIHGGPFTAYGPNFSVEIQRYAAAGYVVLYANPRGSTSYGEDFANLIHHAYPGNDYDDLMSGVDAVIARGNIDTEQLFVTGGSGGGVLTAWIVGKTDRFRAAVVAKPVINWTSFALTADMNNFFYRYWFPAPPWEAQEEYWRRSPLSLVGNVKTPTMLLTGESDYRTPIGESEQFYQALKLRGIPTLMVRMPQASHGMTGRPSQFIAKIDNILAWFERYRKGNESIE